MPLEKEHSEIKAYLNDFDFRHLTFSFGFLYISFVIILVIYPLRLGDGRPKDFNLKELLMKDNNLLRRSKSTCLMSDAIKQQKLYKLHSPDQPIHENVESYFSTASGFTNFRGLLNLCVILLVLSNFRVALENIIKYGILVRPSSFFEIIFSDPYQWPCATLMFGIEFVWCCMVEFPFYVTVSNVFILSIFFIEIFLEKKRISEKPALALQIIVLVSMLLYSSYVVLLIHPNPLFSGPVLSIYTVIFLKLWSYIHVNKWCREGRYMKSTKSTDSSILNKPNGMISTSGLDLAKQNDGISKHSTNNNLRQSDSKTISIINYQKYPDNLHLRDLYYFIFAPTLCYELNFPRTLKIRKRFLWKRSLELFFLPQLIFCLIQQWILPLLQNSVLPFSQAHFSAVVERLLKLSIPNHLIWLMFFYVIFHSGLNVCAELMYFGDRLFYKDWWNAKSVTEFWSTWNIPVHRWARRHIFKPLLKRKYSKLSASIVVFFISAFFHEFLVSVPLRMFRLWSFTAMIGQIPFAMFVSKYLKRSEAGNVAVWISLIIGQPLALMMYFHDYYVQNMLS